MAALAPQSGEKILDIGCGCGQTTLSLALAERFHGEIVNCDSVAVYRELEVGTAKPSAAERAQVPHHLIDLIDPTQSYSAALFREDFLGLMDTHARIASKIALQLAREMARRGAGEILLTSMDRDGTKEGFDLGLTRAITSSVHVPVSASGGVGTLTHLVEGVTEGGATGVLAASIFHFGEFTVGQAKEFLSRQGIPVRF